MVVNGPTDVLPLEFLLPDQPPLAVQFGAVPVTDQLRVDELPLLMLVGEAFRLTTGATTFGVTATVVVALSVPALLVHDSVYVAFDVGLTVWVPLAFLLPVQLPLAVQVGLVPVVDHVRVDEPPLVMLDGAAFSVTVGGVTLLTVTVTDLLSLPAVLVQAKL